MTFQYTPDPDGVQIDVNGLLIIALEKLLAWANIQDFHSEQAVQLRDLCQSAIALAREQRRIA